MFFRVFFSLPEKKYFPVRYRSGIPIQVFFTLVLLVFLMLPALVQAIPLTVAVHGVEGEEHRNIMASIKIALQQKKTNLTLRHIRRLHKAAPEQIVKALAPFGYYSVEVKNDGSLTKDDTGWHAVYEVIPGEPVLVEQVNIKVTGPGKDEDIFQNLKKDFPLQKGERLKDTLYEKGKKNILSDALRNGYIKAGFTTSSVLVRHKEHQAEIQLTLDTGPLFFFGETTSIQDIIMPKMLHRYLPYSLGDVYSFSALNQLQTDLYATGYFSQVFVEPQYPGADNEEPVIPVKVELKPVKKNRYSFGVGYGSDTGARGNIGWKNHIINRHGHKPEFNIQVAENGSRANADYEIPIFDLRYDSVNFGTLFFDETWDDTWIKQLSISGSVNHNAPKHQYGVGLEYLHENYTVGATSGSANLLIPSSYITFIFTENRVKTEHGIRLSASLKGGDTAFLSSTSFLQARANGKIILTPWKSWRLLGRLSIGAIMMDSINELPPSLRFYAGGDHSVRGYGYKELGPEDSSGKIVGGQYLTEASIEIEREITDTWSAAAFYDLGNAYDNIDADLQVGTGLGVRMNLPFGQVRLDVACALSDADYPLRIHLTIGADL
ncbi:autotransporter secretion outer membrane protein TamA [Candidatus Electrothrix aarhusensis]|uniref:Translocation and assembly module subunit TamA n=1 Tax=Candidatus Electrothrix aarhusensis TaxID=1859131 RepID=A0A3S3U628_9BACT|nr:autotransporter secretion outer membrane protein TamA [Candidatus Electrothrix aarhusensis]